MLLSITTSSFLGSLLLSFSIAPAAAVKDVAVETFGDEPNHVWYALNDPVMGGLSTGTFMVQDGVGIFQGEVKDVPSLKAPGFIAARTGRGGYFPDLRSCDGLVMRVKSDTAYEGFRASFGTNFAGTMPYAQGYKTQFDVPVGEFGDVKLAFTDFSDNWDPKTGNVVISCEEDNQYCPDDATLQNFQKFEIMAEGVKGNINLEIQSIHAFGCDDDVSETNPNPKDQAPISTGSGFRGSGGFRPQEHDSVGGYGGYMQPTILENGDVRIESFEDPQHQWYPLNDPVMGGSSTSTVTVQNKAGIFDGEVVNVDFLDAPGFIKMETRGGNFPDVSMCKALKIVLKSANDYDGIRVTFGTHHAADAQPYVRGYKAHLENAPINEFGEIVMPFSAFSDNWSPLTGDIEVSCQEDSKHCVDEKTLKDFTTMSFMGEGVNGKVHLEIKSIDATKCKHSSPIFGAAVSSQGNGVVLSNAALVSIIAGFSLAATLAFFVGRRHGKRSKFIEPPEVEVVHPRNDVL